MISGGEGSDLPKPTRLTMVGDLFMTGNSDEKLSMVSFRAWFCKGVSLSMTWDD